MIAKNSLTDDEKQERKEKQEAALKVTMPKVHAPAASKASKAAAAAAARAAAPAPAAAAGFGFGGFGFGALGGLFGAPRPAAPAAAAARGRSAPRPGLPSDSDDDEDHEGEDDEDDDDDDEDEESSLDSDEGPESGGGDGTILRFEHARSGRSLCRGCRRMIPLRSVRFCVTPGPGSVGYSDYYPEREQFYHAACYAPLVSRAIYPRFDVIPGWARLTAAEKAEVNRVR